MNFLPAHSIAFKEKVHNGCLHVICCCVCMPCRNNYHVCPGQPSDTYHTCITQDGVCSSPHHGAGSALSVSALPHWSQPHTAQGTRSVGCVSHDHCPELYSCPLVSIAAHRWRLVIKLIILHGWAIVHSCCISQADEPQVPQLREEISTR